MAWTLSVDPVTDARGSGRFRFWPGQSRRARGSVTAEFAVVLPAVTALLALLLLGVGAGMSQLRLEEGARAGARAVARGESTAQAVETATRLAGGNTSVVVDISGSYATVTVTGRVQGPLSSVLAWQQSAHAVARVENYDSAAGPVGAAAPGANRFMNWPQRKTLHRTRLSPHHRQVFGALGPTQPQLRLRHG